MAINLKKKYQHLFVNRIGCTEQAFMKTKRIVMELQSGQAYKLDGQALLPTHSPSPYPIIHPRMPPHCILKGHWEVIHHNQDDASNILGDIQTFTAKNQALSIPIAPTNYEMLAYYGARLLHQDESLLFDTHISLPLFEMSIGADYLKGYMLKKQYANGIFLEYHNRPHFHMPVKANASGYLILGKKIHEDTYYLSAFIIPFGSAIYLPPYVIHNDSLLVGSYYVLYAKADDFSTVRLLHPSQAMLNVKIVVRR
ncbi:MAG: hypothetical protein AAF770_03665 [Bacteroidota bacterium]